MLSATKIVSQRWNIKPSTALILICVGSENQQQHKQNKGIKMTTENQTDINEDALVKSFQNEMENVLANAKSWYSNEYKTANEKLYDMFADLYRIYDTLVDTKIVGNTKKREWIEAEVKKRNITFKSNKPTLQQLLINYAFRVDGVECSKRISAYVRVFNIIIATEGVRVDNVAEWIAKEGGIEEIRQKATSTTISKEERSVEGKKFLQNELQSTFSYSSANTIAYAADKANEVVLLVGILEADGKVKIKHEIYEKNPHTEISGKTAINTALANVYSNWKEAEKKAKEQTKDIGEAKDNTPTKTPTSELHKFLGMPTKELEAV